MRAVLDVLVLYAGAAVVGVGGFLALTVASVWLVERFRGTAR